MAKLVDILARELKVWPLGYPDVGQANEGCLHLPGIGLHDRHTDEVYTKADDWFSAIVTRAEWQDARDALSKPAISVIDWSKAPADFPLWLEGTSAEHRKHSGWYRPDGELFKGDDGGQWRANREGQFFIVHRKPAGHQQAAWNGEGLPPVGTVCEYCLDNKWTRIEVVARVNDAFGDVAVFRFLDFVDWSSSKTTSRFRPIRTAEQIAADERKIAIWKMACDCGYGHNEDHGYDVSPIFAAIYDAGYRKQEQSK